VYYNAGVAVVISMARAGGVVVRLQNKRSRVRIPLGCEVLRNVYIAVLLIEINIHRHCVYLRKINY
jgi:hypothetical protein